MNKNISITKKKILIIEQLLNDSARIKKELNTSDFDRLAKELEVLEKDYIRWVIRASVLVRKKYVPLISFRVDTLLRDQCGGTILVAKRKSLLLGDIICIEDDIRKKLIQLKKLTSEKSHLIRELILKEVRNNEDLKEMYETLLADKFGAMARYISCNGPLPEDIKYSPSRLTYIKHLYEINFKDKLKKILEKQLEEKISLIEFDIAYLEAKDDLVVQEKTRPSEPRVKEKESRKPEAEKAGYAVYLSKEKGIGTSTIEATKNKVDKEYLSGKENYDIFIYTRSVYSKKRDVRTGKRAVSLVELDQRMYVLLVLFLKYKDSSLNVFALFKKAWEHVPKNYDGRPDYKRTMEYLKSTISELKSKIGVDALEIKKPRNSEGYICSGSFKFCVIIDKSQSDKYILSDFDIKDAD